ncbi:hypothetical protein [Effusibacillus consociatus]|uniref:Uncharacterized protein n=1 Tax=Effusibacillus consociatus TaxID=1117041 RepID=A0ABV9Q1I4_9BACL
MKFSSRIKVSLATALVGSLALSTPTFAANSICYYSFESEMYMGSNSSSFTPTNSDNVLTIVGWQDTNDNSKPADVEYKLIRSGFWGSTLVGSVRISGNKPQAVPSTWYRHVFTGVSPNYNYKLYTANWSQKTVRGAGNAYDGY